MDAHLTADELAGRLAEQAAANDLNVAVAESLTGGMVSSLLAASGGASQWYRGGVVAYSPDVKHDVLDVGDTPIVSDRTAEAMADGVAELLAADLTIALTGIGGPDPQDGLPAGTVWVAVHGPRGTATRLLDLTGSPEEVCEQASTEALRLAVELIDELT